MTRSQWYSTVSTHQPRRGNLLARIVLLALISGLLFYGVPALILWRIFG